MQNIKNQPPPSLALELIKARISSHWLLMSARAKCSSSSSSPSPSSCSSLCSSSSRNSSSSTTRTLFACLGFDKTLHVMLSLWFLTLFVSPSALKLLPRAADPLADIVCLLLSGSWSLGMKQLGVCLQPDIHRHYRHLSSV